MDLNMNEELSLKQQVVVALELCKQAKDLIDEMLALTPVEQMSERRLDILSAALDNQTLSWQKLGELMHSYAMANDYNFDQL